MTEEFRRALFFKDKLVNRSDLNKHQHSRHGSLVQMEQYDLRSQIWLFHSQSYFFFGVGHNGTSHHFISCWIRVGQWLCHCVAILDSHARLRSIFQRKNQNKNTIRIGEAPSQVRFKNSVESF